MCKRTVITLLACFCVQTISSPGLANQANEKYMLCTADEKKKRHQLPSLKTRISTMWRFLSRIRTIIEPINIQDIGNSQKMTPGPETTLRRKVSPLRRFTTRAFKVSYPQNTGRVIQHCYSLASSSLSAIWQRRYNTSLLSNQEIQRQLAHSSTELPVHELS